jgi:hypothetical protein
VPATGAHSVPLPLYYRGLNGLIRGAGSTVSQTRPRTALDRRAHVRAPRRVYMRPPAGSPLCSRLPQSGTSRSETRLLPTVARKLPGQSQPSQVRPPKQVARPASNASPLAHPVPAPSTPKIPTNPTPPGWRRQSEDGGRHRRGTCAEPSSAPLPTSPSTLVHPRRGSADPRTVSAERDHPRHRRPPRSPLPLRGPPSSVRGCPPTVIPVVVHPPDGHRRPSPRSHLGVAHRGRRPS